MKPRERRDSGQGDLLRSRLDAILDMDHQLVALARKVDWGFLEKRFGEVYRDGPGQPPLPTRLMAGLTILKYTYDLSDEELCARWVENPYYQLFCGEEFFQHELVLDRSSLTRWRQRMGEEKMKALLQESLSIAVKTNAVKPSELSEVIVDTTVEPKNVISVATTHRHAKGGQFVTHAKALPGNPYDGHTLATVIPDMEALVGNTIKRIFADKGYRGHNAPPDYKFRVFIAGQKRRMTPKIKREMRRRSAVEPVIGHLKSEHRMGRNYLWHRQGDAINAVLAAAGYNFRLLLRWLRLLLFRFLIVFFNSIQAALPSYR